MSKWKCGICGSEFDNFHAQGFEGTIYCPLCYYKKLYKDTELERERLNNIINGIEQYIKYYVMNNFKFDHNTADIILYQLEQLKDSDKE